MTTTSHYWIHSAMNELDTDNQSHRWSRPAVQQCTDQTDQQWSVGQDVVVAVVAQHAAAAAARADLTEYVLTSDKTQIHTTRLEQSIGINS